MLSLLLIAPLHVRAGNVEFADVAQSIVGVQAGQPRVELRLRHMSQSGRAPVVTSAAAQQGTGNAGPSSAATQNGAQTAPSGGGSPTLTGIEPAQGGTTGQVQVVDLGEVTGTVCDCGRLPPVDIPGGFPLWPLFGLGAIPLFFLPDDEPDIEVFPTPTPTPIPETPIPEPTTILLLGSSLLALGAGARRRRAAQKDLAKGIVVAEEG